MPNKNFINNYTTYDTTVTGAVGASPSVTSVYSGGGWSYTAAPLYYITPSSSMWTSNVGSTDLTIQYQNQTIEVGKTLKMLMDRLCVITPNLPLMEKYPALKEAYDNYKLLEALLANEDNTKDE
jgi:hypothetical protein